MKRIYSLLNRVGSKASQPDVLKESSPGVKVWMDFNVQTSISRRTIMLYVAVDQHAKQLTVSVRNVAGDVILRRQVSTEWGKVRAFWDGIREQSPEGFVVILEVCGLNDWLVALLTAISECQLVLVQAPQRASTKTDRRDADRLGELLWVNRSRLAAGQRVSGLRRIMIPSKVDSENRQLTGVRQR